MPKITQISRQVRNSNRVSVFIDEQFAFGLEEDQVYAFHLHIGEEISNERLYEIEQGALFTSAKTVAQRYLARSMRSELEVRKRLKEKEIPQRIVDQTIAWLLQYKFIDDSEYARAYIRTQQTLRPASRVKLISGLLKKGIAKPVIESALNELLDESADYSTAAKLASAYASKNRNFDPKVMQRRLAGYLQRRGFRLSTVFRVLEETTGYAGD